MSDKTRELPNPIAETITWCRLNRPDCAEYLERIYQSECDRPSEGSQALLLLISLGFSAGFAFQASSGHDQVPLPGESPYGP